MDINKEIYDFVSTHEAIISNEMKNRDENIKVHFTTFGNRAGCRAIKDIIDLVDDDTKLKIFEMMKNKRINE